MFDYTVGKWFNYWRRKGYCNLLVTHIIKWGLKAYFCKKNQIDKLYYLRK